jgi:hypothetical protein
MTEDFETWRAQALRILSGWHRLDAERVGEDHWWRCFGRGYRPKLGSLGALDHRANAAGSRCAGRTSRIRLG